VCGSGVVVCSLSLLIRWAQRARCQAETPLIVLCRFPGPALATTGGVTIYAGATGIVGSFTTTYTGLKIEGGSGTDFIENDAKNGIVTDGNGADPRNEGLALPATLADFVGHIPFLGKPPCCGKPVGRERQSPRLDTWQKG